MIVNESVTDVGKLRTDADLSGRVNAVNWARFARVARVGFWLHLGQGGNGLH
jgi:hypothetical protein